MPGYQIRLLDHQATGRPSLPRVPSGHPRFANPHDYGFTAERERCAMDDDGDHGQGHGRLLQDRRTAPPRTPPALALA